MTEVEYEEIVRECWAETLRVVNRKVSPREDAEDIVLEVFVKLWKYKDGLETDRITNWINAVARTTVVDHYRRGVTPHLPLLDELYRGDPDRFTDPLFSFLERERADKVLSLMEKSLSDRQEEILHLSFGQGKTPTEVGVIIGIKTCAVSAGKRRALANLKVLLS